jgi:hypothetical protein
MITPRYRLITTANEGDGWGKNKGKTIFKSSKKTGSGTSNSTKKGEMGEKKSPMKRITGASGTT